MEVKEFINNIPPFTRYYLISLFITAFILSYLGSFVKLIMYMIFDYDAIVHKFQIWRCFTNFIISGPFSMQFLMNIFLTYSLLSNLEKKYLETRRYAEFIMMIFYLSIFINILVIISHFLFQFRPFTLSHELLFSIIYVNSKRDPDVDVMLYFGIKVKNKYVPYALMLLEVVTGGSIVSSLIGILAGHFYFFFKDIAPLNYHRDILKTPYFVVKQCEKWIGYEDVNNRNNNGYSSQDRPRFSSVNNSQSSGDFVNRNSNSNSSSSNNNNGERRGYVPFSGRGTSLS